MALIQPYMAVKCRTPEEVEIFIETAKAEGHKEPRFHDKNKVVFVTNYTSSFTYPDDIGHTSDIDYVDGHPNSTKIIVEAADLFRNQLISRRIKHVQNMDKQ